MSYDIYIGEAAMGDPCADEHNELDLTVHGVRLDDLSEVRVALANWRAANPGTTPGFGDRDYLDGEVARLRRWMEANQGESAERLACVAETLADRIRSQGALPPEGRFDPILARLLWLEWWMNWALTNCKVPAIHNH